MQVICSWCRGEGRVGIVGEKPPLEDRRETHSICLEHEKAVRARWAACRENDSSYLETTASVRDRTSRLPRIRWAVRSVVRLYVGLKGLAKKNRV